MWQYIRLGTSQVLAPNIPETDPILTKLYYNMASQSRNDSYRLPELRWATAMEQVILSAQGVNNHTPFNWLYFIIDWNIQIKFQIIFKKQQCLFDTW